MISGSMPCSQQKKDDCGVFTLQHLEALYTNRSQIEWANPESIDVNAYISLARLGAKNAAKNRAIQRERDGWTTSLPLPPDLCALFRQLGPEMDWVGAVDRRRHILTT